MSTEATSGQEGIDLREKRARWEAFEFDVPAEGLVEVTNVSREDPTTYTVKVEDGEPVACTCPDWVHREPEGGCKHQRSLLEPVLVAAEMNREECPNGEEWCSGPAGEELPCFECYVDGS